MKGMYPEENVPFCLPIHSGIAEAERPTFYARFLTRREEIKLQVMRQKAFNDPGSAGKDHEKQEEALAKSLVEVLLYQLSGWAHITDDKSNPIPFTKAGGIKVIDMLSTEDGWSLHRLAMDAITAKREELGKSESSATSKPANTASAASPTAAAAGTAPTSPPPATPASTTA